jgi:alkylhydroperoxidase family enzyme
MEGKTERVRRIGIEEATGETRRTFDLYQKERGNVPNMFRTMAHRPVLLRTMIAHFRAVMAPSTIDVRLKELIAVAVSGIHRCDY